MSRRRAFWWSLGGVAALLAVLVAAALLILPSRWFRDYVRGKMVAAIENASGGEAEIGEFAFDWRKLRAEVKPFVLHGTEPPGEAPFFRAERIAVGFRVISWWRRNIDIQSLEIDGPAINLLVDSSGITNLPKAKRRSGGPTPISRFVDLAIDRVDVRDGLLHYGDRKIRLDLRGEDLDARLVYDAAAPSYTGEVTMAKLDVRAGPTLPMSFSFRSRLALERNRLSVERAHLGMPKSHLDVSGELADFSKPKATFHVKAFGDLEDLGKPLKITQPYRGTASVDAMATYSAAEGYQLKGKVAGTGIAVRYGRLHVTGAAASADLRLTPRDLILTGVSANALGGGFTGRVVFEQFRRYTVEGEVHRLPVSNAAAAVAVAGLPWDGSLTGPVKLASTVGQPDLKISARMQVEPAGGAHPVAGTLDVGYDQKTKVVTLGESTLNTPATAMNFSGTLGRTLQVKVTSRDLNDVIPALRFASPGAPTSLPVQLRNGGSARFEGTVEGELPNANVDGQLTLTQFTVSGHDMDRLVAGVHADAASLRVRTFGLAEGTARLSGSLDLQLNNWRVTQASAVTAKVELENAQLERLLREAGQKLPIQGDISATAEISGSTGDPKADIRVSVSRLTAFGEKFERFTGQVRYAGSGVEVIDGVFRAGNGRVLVDGAYLHPPSNWTQGQLQMKIHSEGLTLSQIQNVQQRRPGLAAQIAVEAAASAQVRNGGVQLTSLNGRVQIQSLSVDKSPIGNFVADASTKAGHLEVTAHGDLRGTRVQGQGEFELSGDYPAKGSLDVSPLTFATIQDLLAATSSISRPLPFDGSVSGHLTFDGPIRNLRQFKARAEIPALRIEPAKRSAVPGAAKLALRNEGPIVLEYDGGPIHVRSAHLTGEDTDLTVRGTVNLMDSTPWNLNAQGNVNLAVLRSFNPDLVTSGAAVVNANIRGTLAQPAVAGRLELRNGSFYARNIPNGLDNVNGLILFDRSRATVEKMTAESGGGTLALSGFIGYASAPITYQLQARGDRIRLRYPEGVSSTADAVLTLTGSSARSTLTGNVTVRRLSFNPRTDIGGLLTAAAKPVETPSVPNETMRNMQLEVRVDTVPNLQFVASMTNDVQLEADLRVRGTLAKPVVLGRVNIDQGEIQFFGNKYTINRGEIGFYNPVKFEPVLDMDLETRVRGVVVTINFSGPINKLNVAYRSDPPLQASEIIALLAVGRTPGVTSGLASSQTTATNSLGGGGGTNNLLGQAIAAPVSSRLQRFFGVSRLKIDPQLTNLDAIPQARLTLEQQISKDVTLTYITNLSKTNQQIVRLEWDLNRNWSLIAVREENGVFGVDFLYKKRFR